MQDDFSNGHEQRSVRHNLKNCATVTAGAGGNGSVFQGHAGDENSGFLPVQE
jgi:hypothetical protein